MKFLFLMALMIFFISCSISDKQMDNVRPNLIMKSFNYQDTLKQTFYVDVIKDISVTGISGSDGTMHFYLKSTLYFLKKRDDFGLITYWERDSLGVDKTELYVYPNDMKLWQEYIIYSGIVNAKSPQEIFLNEKDIYDFVNTFDNIYLLSFCVEKVEKRGAVLFSYEMWEIYRE